MYYVKDIESIGGLFIKERVIKKGFRYEIIKCLLYISGEKFQVLLQEFKRGKGIVLDVVAENGEEQNLKREKLDNLIEKYSRNENSLIAYYQQKREEVKRKSSFLLRFDVILIICSLNKLIKLYCNGLLFTTQGMTAGFTFIVGILLLFGIESLRSLYTRG